MNQETLSEDKKKSTLKPLYARSVVNSLGVGMVNPFMGAYAVKLGASSSEMGWFQSSTNISNNLMQLFWGRLSDRLKRRIPFIAFGSLTVSLLWIPMVFVANASQLIILLAAQALLGSMATPAWTALIGDLVPSLKLGRANATISLWASIGSLIATLTSGLAMITIGGTLHEMFFIPLAVATGCGIASSIIMLTIKESKNGEKPGLRRHFVSEIFDMIRYARKSPDFLKYCYVEGVFEFFMSISWPLIAITQITVLGASMLQIALLTVVQSFVMIIFQGWAGKLADTVGRRPLLVFFRFSLVTVPIAYAFVPDINTLIVVGAFWGIAMALGQASVTAYLLDVSPEEYRGSFIALFNLVMGVTSFFGSLISGYLSDYMTGVFGLITGLQIAYMISMGGRGIGAALHLTLKETLKRKTT
ncbi:MAG: MFS transporter [Candidatus Bathyarchaeota archaeon]|nr:MFS transporter [Candidatus Bathyarchaeota archaeon]